MRQKKPFETLSARARSAMGLGFVIFISFAVTPHSTGRLRADGGGSWARQATLALDPVDAGAFGSSVAMAADGQTIAVGAPNYYTQGGGGLVDIYDRVGSSWGGPTEFKADHQFDNLGASVAMSADGNTVLAGAPDKEVDGVYTGAAEVYTRTDSGWTGPIELTAGQAIGSESRFGTTVALSGDGKTALVGITGQAFAAAPNGSGGAEAFQLSGGTWNRTGLLTLGSQARSSDRLGASLALNTDGTMAFVGAPGRSVDGTAAAGAVQVFTPSQGGWAPTEELSLGTQSVEEGDFGASVDISSTGTVVVGAPWEQMGSQDNAGAAYIFASESGTFGSPVQVSDPMPRNGDDFGASVRVSADGQTIVVGAPYRHVGREPTVGFTDLFVTSRGDWAFGGQIAGLNAGDRFGTSVALTGNGQTAVIGAPGRFSADKNFPYGAADVLTGGPPVIVSVRANGLYGSQPQLASIASTASLISYDPPSRASSVTGTLSCTTTATATSVVPGDPYPIEDCQGLGSAQFSLAYDYGNSGYEVLPTPLDIQPNPIAVVYEARVPAVTWHATFVNNQTSAVLTKQPACLIHASLTSGRDKAHAGVYPITCSAAYDPNYHISYGRSAFTVSPAPLLVRPHNEAAQHGQAMPPLLWSANFLQGDSLTSLSRKPQCHTGARLDSQGDIASPAGLYPINCQNGAARDYTLSYVPGTLTVEPERVGLRFGGSGMMKQGEPATLRAFIFVPGGHFVVGRRLTITMGTGSSAQRCTTAPSSAKGTGTCHLQAVHQPLGPVLASVAFAGDPAGAADFYAAAKVSTVVRVVAD